MPAFFLYLSMKFQIIVKNTCDFFSSVINYMCLFKGMGVHSYFVITKAKTVQQSERDLFILQVRYGLSNSRCLLFYRNKYRLL